MLSSRPVVKTIAALASATALAQLLALAILPVLARLLGPAEMGYWGSFIAIFSVLVPVAALALPQALVVADSDHKAKALAQLSLLCALGSALFITVFYVVVSDLVPDLLPSYLTPWSIFCLAGALVVAVTVQLVQQWLLRQQQFRLLAKADLVQAVLLNLSKVAVVLFWPVAAALMLVQALVPLCQFIHLKGWQLFYPQAAKQLLTQPDTRQEEHLKLSSLLKEFRDFPLYQSPQQLLNAAAQALPVFILAPAFGLAAVGFYTLAKTVLLAPAAWVNKAIADFLYPAFSTLQRQQLALQPLFVRSTLWLALLGVVPVVLLFYLAPRLFGLLFGEEWLPAAEMAQWLCPWLYCFLVNPPAVKLVMVLRLQSAALILNIITLALRSAVLCYGALYLQDLQFSVLAFSLVGVLHNVLFVALAWWGCGRADRLLNRSASLL